ncbi:hypothetical protein CBM2626_U40033 [Cupriavidus taiwanensis]|nr:hypothetical protein CBM2626_U40033 [Cupriavidus taiwanensis]
MRPDTVSQLSQRPMFCAGRGRPMLDGSSQVIRDRDRQVRVERGHHDGLCGRQSHVAVCPRASPGQGDRLSANTQHFKLQPDLLAKAADRFEVHLEVDRWHPEPARANHTVVPIRQQGVDPAFDQVVKHHEVLGGNTIPAGSHSEKWILCWRLKVCGAVMIFNSCKGFGVRSRQRVAHQGFLQLLARPASPDQELVATYVSAHPLQRPQIF